MATFHVHQKLTVFANQYRIYADADGKPGELLAFAHQKRLALREQFTFYRNEKKEQVLFTVQARNIMDLAGVYDVTDAADELLGTLRKQFKQSLLRSTWNISTPGNDDTFLTVSERNMVIAVFRRLWEFIPFVGDLPFIPRFHFDFYDPVLKTTVGSYNKTTYILDRYVLQVDDATLENIDWRVLAAQGVALDALQHR